MSRASRYLVAVVLLTLVYVLALASFKPLDLLLGAVVSAVLVFALRRVLFGNGVGGEGPGLLERLVASPAFVWAVIREVVAGTWEVALVTLHLRKIESPGIVAVPIGDRTPTGVAVSALCTTLSPGSFLVDVDRERRVMLLHVIDASSPETVRAEREEFYRRYQRWVFP